MNVEFSDDGNICLLLFVPNFNMRQKKLNYHKFSGTCPLPSGNFVISTSYCRTETKNLSWDILIRNDKNKMSTITSHFSVIHNNDVINCCAILHIFDIIKSVNKANTKQDIAEHHGTFVAWSQTQSLNNVKIKKKNQILLNVRNVIIFHLNFKKKGSKFLTKMHRKFSRWPTRCKWYFSYSTQKKRFH